MIDYKRLTMRNKDFIDTNCKNCKQCKKVGRKYICNDMTACDEEIINRLAELEDKIENGTLIDLPCKVGDVLYYACPLKKIIEKHVVTGFDISKELSIRTISDCYSNGNYVAYFYPSYFNKTLFKTKIEAEKKLEELKGEENG